MDGRTGGAQAVPEAPQAPSPEAASETHEAERRQLTVMFCDLVGTAGLSERLAGIERLTRDLRTDKDIELAVRLGLHAGLVVVGETPNVAALLDDLA